MNRIPLNRTIFYANAKEEDIAKNVFSSGSVYTMPISTIFSPNNVLPSEDSLIINSNGSLYRILKVETDKKIMNVELLSISGTGGTGGFSGGSGSYGGYFDTSNYNLTLDLYKTSETSSPLTGNEITYNCVNDDRCIIYYVYKSYDNNGNFESGNTS